MFGKYSLLYISHTRYFDKLILFAARGRYKGNRQPLPLNFALYPAQKAPDRLPSLMSKIFRC
jgi:hypothetical protein